MPKAINADVEAEAAHSERKEERPLFISLALFLFSRMHVDYLIVGQGICGSFLSHELRKAGASFLVIDNADKFSASRVASGIINPVTGRRIVKTWMIDELLPFAKEAYTALQLEMRTKLINETTTIDFFPTPQMLLAFRKRIEEAAEYLSMPAEDPQWWSLINYDFGYGLIDPCLLVDVDALLTSTRQQLLSTGKLMEEKFELPLLQLQQDYILYKEIRAHKIIYCDGMSSFTNPYFQLLPFAPNKGEVLLAEIKELPRESILKYGLSLVPWKENLFWIGASHEWKFETDQPTVSYRASTTAQLKRILKCPFEIVDHLAAVRPATLERRPFIGLHPVHSQVGIFNGMGTKGCSLAPYFAHQFAQFLLHGQPLLPEADISRFRNVLSRA